MTADLSPQGDALQVFRLPGIHIFVGGYTEPPTPFFCERCEKRWDTLDDALSEPCRG